MRAMINKLFLVVSIFISTPSFAQEIYKEFKFKNPETMISNSEYNAVEFIDSRIMTSNLGIVQVGLGNNHAKVITEIPLQQQLNDFIASITDSTAKNGTLLLQLRHFLFAETTTMASETGYCYLRANLFSKYKDDYFKMVAIDTFIMVKGMDVTNRLLKAGSNLITDMIISTIKTKPNVNEVLSYHQIVKTDSIEKRSIKIYNTNTYEEGLYYSYESFKNQIPDDAAIVKKNRDSTIKSVFIEDENKNLLKLKSEDFYAFVLNGKPYISTGFGYFPVYKSDDYFYFIGKVKPITTDQTSVMVASMMFGMIGGIIAASVYDPGENYFNIIEHSNGGFIQIKKMPANQL